MLMREGGGVCPKGIFFIFMAIMGEQREAFELATKLKLSSADARKIAKGCIDQTNKYGLPRKKKKK